MFSNKSSSPIEKIDPFSLCFFRKHNIQWFNFITIIEVTNIVIVAFFTKIDIVRYEYFFSIYISQKNDSLMKIKPIFFNLNIPINCNFIYSNQFFMLYNAPLFKVKLAFCAIFIASY